MPVHSGWATRRRQDCNPGRRASRPANPRAGLSGRLRAVPPGRELPPQRQTADGAHSGTRTSPTSPRGREGGWGPIRESSSAHKCLENSSFLVPGQRTQDEERAPQAASRPAATKRELWRQYQTESGDHELADNEQHRAVFGAAGVRDSGGSGSPLRAAPEMPGTAQAGPASGPSSRRPSRPGPRRRVPLGGSPACPPLPVALLGGRPPSRPPAAIPAAAHLRARRPPGLPSPGVRSRPAAPPPPPLAPPPRSRNRSLPGPSSRLRQSQCDVTSGRVRSRAGSPGLANAPGASPEPGARPRMTTNSSRGGGGGVR